MSKKSLKVVATIDYAAMGKNIGAAIAACAKAEQAEKAKASSTVKQLLDEILAGGFDFAVDSGKFYAPSKNKSGILYTPCINAMGDDIGKGSRDNRMSKIRAYLKAAGQEPLDLFGNIAAKKMAEAKAEAAKDTTGDEPKSNKSAKSEKATVMELVANYRGFENMSNVLCEFIIQNESDGDKLSPAMDQILDMVNDLNEAIKAAIVAATKKPTSRRSHK